jgi:hypothetical protein
MTLLRELADVDVPGAETERPGHGLLLLLEGRALEVEVDLVRADLLLLRREEPDHEPGVVAGQQGDALLGIVGRLPAQDAGPEACEKERVDGIEAEREEVGSHLAPKLRSAESWRRQDPCGLPARKETLGPSGARTQRE